LKNDHWEVTPEVTCIRLTQGRFALVDTVDLPKISDYNWHAQKGNSRVETFYACAGFSKPGGGKGILKMHRLIVGARPGFEVDHRDWNGLNNSSIFGRKNIAEVDRRGNAQNQRIFWKTSKYAGVSWKKRIRRWIAQINVNGHVIHLGTFTEEERAAKAYTDACEQVAERRIVS
jgi:hypothetical protein